MRIGIYHDLIKKVSVGRIYREIKALGHTPIYIKGSEINIMVGSPRKFRIYHKNEKFILPPVMISRLHSTAGGFNLLIQSHIQRTRRTRVVNRAMAISYARDKYRSMQVLASKGFAIPKTVLLGRSKDIEWAIKQVGGLPIILKVSRGHSGKGVILVNNLSTAKSVHDIVKDNSKMVVQEYIATEPGVDYRFYIVGDKVMGAMRRSAKSQNEFRANFSLGGKIQDYKPSPQVANLAVRVSQALGLEVCGVDMIKTEGGFVPIEVNVNPGLKGIEKATGLNIGKKIAQYLVKEGEKFLAKNPRVKQREEALYSNKPKSA